jgi:peroxiredoxin
MQVQKVILSLALGSAAAFSPSIGSMRQQQTSLRMSIAVGEQFPAPALSKIGVAGKPAVLYFYGADEAPSCTKQAEGFDAAAGDFGGVTVVGIRNDKGVKDGFADKYVQQFYVDVDDEIRNEIGIPKDLFVLGGRETYVVDKDGTVMMVRNSWLPRHRRDWLISTQVFNGQLNPEKHVEAASAAVADLPKGGGGFDLASLLPL